VHAGADERVESAGGRIETRRAGHVYMIFMVPTFILIPPQGRRPT
jgi:hypothetical protein